jgi:Mg/Co/Ni transporter MgtE
METVFEALARVRSEPGGSRTIYYYVTDSQDRLVGVAPVRRLLLAEPGMLVGEMMVHPVLSANESGSFTGPLPSWLSTAFWRCP